ncbi:hypothetical protein [Branchiibius hedensis]|uniref:hypothetical protein n=1 Tax=Branchiibius hedensis TaxID=672460 RepID=UPI0011B27D74|nr:hypothetical protein [Branchiibius hedensis]
MLPIGVLGSILVIVGRLIGQHRLDVGQLVVLIVATACWLYARFATRRRSALTADTGAIHLPTPMRDLYWNDVAHVQAPTRWSDVVRVVMNDGTEKPTGFPPEYAERLAAVGRKPLR